MVYVNGQWLPVWPKPPLPRLLSGKSSTRLTAGRGTGKMTPEAVATAIIRAIERGDSEHYIGKTRLLKWLLRLAPGVAYRILKDG